MPFFSRKKKPSESPARPVIEPQAFGDGGGFDDSFSPNGTLSDVLGGGGGAASSPSSSSRRASMSIPPIPDIASLAGSGHNNGGDDSDEGGRIESPGKGSSMSQRRVSATPAQPNNYSYGISPNIDPLADTAVLGGHHNNNEGDESLPPTPRSATRSISSSPVPRHHGDDGSPLVSMQSHQFPVQVTPSTPATVVVRTPQYMGGAGGGATTSSSTPPTATPSGPPPRPPGSRADSDDYSVKRDHSVVGNSGQQNQHGGKIVGGGGGAAHQFDLYQIAETEEEADGLIKRIKEVEKENLVLAVNMQHICDDNGKLADKVDSLTRRVAFLLEDNVHQQFLEKSVLADLRDPQTTNGWFGHSTKNETKNHLKVIAEKLEIEYKYYRDSHSSTNEEVRSLVFKLKSAHERNAELSRLMATARAKGECAIVVRKMLPGYQSPHPPTTTADDDTENKNDKKDENVDELVSLRVEKELHAALAAQEAKLNESHTMAMKVQKDALSLEHATLTKKDQATIEVLTDALDDIREGREVRGSFSSHLEKQLKEATDEIKKLRADQEALNEEHDELRDTNAELLHALETAKFELANAATAAALAATAATISTAPPPLPAHSVTEVAKATPSEVSPSVASTSPTSANTDVVVKQLAEAKETIKSLEGRLASAQDARLSETKAHAKTCAELENALLETEEQLEALQRGTQEVVAAAPAPVVVESVPEASPLITEEELSALQEELTTLREELASLTESTTLLTAERDEAIAAYVELENAAEATRKEQEATISMLEEKIVSAQERMARMDLAVMEAESAEPVQPVVEESKSDKKKSGHKRSGSIVSNASAQSNQSAQHGGVSLSRFAEIQAMNDRLKDELSLAEEHHSIEKEELEKRVASLTDELQVSQRMLDVADADDTAVKSEMSDLRNRVAVQEEEIAALKSALEVSMESATNIAPVSAPPSPTKQPQQDTTTTTTTTTTTPANAELIANLQQEIATAKAEKEKSDKLLFGVEHRLVEAQQQLAKMDIEKDSTVSFAQFTALEVANDSLKQEIQERNDELDTLRYKVVGLSEEITLLKGALESKSSEPTTSIEDTTKITVLEQQVATAKAEKEKSDKLLFGVEHRLVEAQQQLAKMDIEKDSTVSFAQFTALEVANDSLKHELQERDEVIETLRRQQGIMQEQAFVLKSEIDRSTSPVVAAVATTTTEDAGIQSSPSKALPPGCLSSTEVDALRKKYEVASNQGDAKATEIARLHREITGFTSKIAAMERDHEDLTTQVHTYKTRCDFLTDELTTARTAQQQQQQPAAFDDGIVHSTDNDEDGRGSSMAGSEDIHRSGVDTKGLDTKDKALRALSALHIKYNTVLQNKVKVERDTKRKIAGLQESNHDQEVLITDLRSTLRKLDYDRNLLESKLKSEKKGAGGGGRSVSPSVTPPASHHNQHHHADGDVDTMTIHPEEYYRLKVEIDRRQMESHKLLQAMKEQEIEYKEMIASLTKRLKIAISGGGAQNNTSGALIDPSIGSGSVSRTTSQQSIHSPTSTQKVHDALKRANDRLQEEREELLKRIAVLEGALKVAGAPQPSGASPEGSNVYSSIAPTTDSNTSRRSGGGAGLAALHESIERERSANTALTEAEADVDRLLKRVRNFDDESKRYAAMIADKEVRIEELEATIAAMKQMRESESMRVAESANSTSPSLLAVIREKAALVAELDVAENNLSREKATVRRLEDDMHQLERELIVQLEQGKQLGVRQQERAVQDCKAEISALKAKLSELEDVDTNAVDPEAMAALEETVNKQQDEISTLRKKAGSLEQQVHQKAATPIAAPVDTTRQVELERECARLREQVSEEERVAEHRLARQLETHREELRNITTRHEGRIREIEDHHRSTSVLQKDTIHNLENQLRQLEKEIEDIHENTDLSATNRQKEMVTLLQDKRQLEKETSELRAEMEKLVTESVVLQRDYALSKERVSELEGELASGHHRHGGGDASLPSSDAEGAAPKVPGWRKQLSKSKGLSVKGTRSHNNNNNNNADDDFENLDDSLPPSDAEDNNNTSTMLLVENKKLSATIKDLESQIEALNLAATTSNKKSPLTSTDDETQAELLKYITDLEAHQASLLTDADELTSALIESKEELIQYKSLCDRLGIPTNPLPDPSSPEGIRFQRMAKLRMEAITLLEMAESAKFYTYSRSMGRSDERGGGGGAQMRSKSAPAARKVVAETRSALKQQQQAQPTSGRKVTVVDPVGSPTTTSKRGASSTAPAAAPVSNAALSAATLNATKRSTTSNITTAPSSSSRAYNFTSAVGADAVAAKLAALGGGGDDDDDMNASLEDVSATPTPAPLAAPSLPQEMGPAATLLTATPTAASKRGVGATRGGGVVPSESPSRVLMSDASPNPVDPTPATARIRQAAAAAAATPANDDTDNNTSTPAPGKATDERNALLTRKPAGAAKPRVKSTRPDSAWSQALAEEKPSTPTTAAATPIPSSIRDPLPPKPKQQQPKQQPKKPVEDDLNASVDSLAFSDLDITSDDEDAAPPKKGGPSTSAPLSVLERAEAEAKRRDAAAASGKKNSKRSPSTDDSSDIDDLRVVSKALGRDTTSSGDGKKNAPRFQFGRGSAASTSKPSSSGGGGGWRR